jgi:hypothetical protein
MRVAISGTHCCGKSTLIDEFLLAHPHFEYEPEAYEALQEEYGETFAADPCAEDFYQQLEYNVGRLRQYGSSDSVIFERSPADYLAYMFALAELGRDRDASRLVANSLAVVQDAIPLLDLVVFLPANDLHVEVPDSEDPALRSAVDTRLEGILIDDDLGWFGSSHPVVLIVSGTPAQRLQIIESAMRSQITEPKRAV